MTDYYRPQAVFAPFVPMLTHEIALGVCFFSLFKQSDNRGRFFVPIVVLFFLGTYLASDFVAHDFDNDILIRYKLIVLVHMSFFHCIVSSEELEEERRRHVYNGVHGDRNWTFAYKMMWNTLCIGTRWEVTVRDDKVVRKQSTPAPSPPAPESNPGHADRALEFGGTPIPISRWSLVTRRVIVLLFRYIALCIYFLLCDARQ
jgi:hypothetical protein